MTSEVEQRATFITAGYGQHRHQWAKACVQALQKTSLTENFDSDSNADDVCSVCTMYHFPEGRKKFKLVYS